MTPKQIAALQAVAVTAASLAVTRGLVSEDVSSEVVALVAAAFAALGALLSSPRDK